MSDCCANISVQLNNASINSVVNNATINVSIDNATVSTTLSQANISTQLNDASLEVNANIIGNQLVSTVITGASLTGSDADTNRTFTVSSGNVIQVYGDLQHMRLNTDYSVSGQVITFLKRTRDATIITIYTQ